MGDFNSNIGCDADNGIVGAKKGVKNIIRIKLDNYICPAKFKANQKWMSPKILSWWPKGDTIRGWKKKKDNFTK